MFVAKKKVRNPLLLWVKQTCLKNHTLQRKKQTRGCCKATVLEGRGLWLAAVGSVLLKVSNSYLSENLALMQGCVKIRMSK